MRFVYVFILFILTNISFSQKEANIWYFGNKQGVDFNSGSPVALADGALWTNEGCSSVSDKSGNLLFYTDGITVYNRLHVRMSRGFSLKGDYSSTQSVIIVKQPESSTIYYIFTTDAIESHGADGLNYTIVDMSLDGGNGDVILFKKNIPLTWPTDEKLTAVLHSNKKDVWIIAADATSNKYYSYLLTSLGVSYVSSSAAGAPKSSITAGYLKSSPDGKYIVDARELSGHDVEIFKFDNTTGAISGWFNAVVYGAPYGVEFSPDNSRLYIGTVNSKDIVQFDLSSGVPSTILASQTKIVTTPGYQLGALQLGPDKKIYLVEKNGLFLSCIPNPNILGVGCGYIEKAVNLLGNKCEWGLPNFLPSFFYSAPFSYTNSCVGIPTNFLIQDSVSPSGVTWNFGDPASGAANTASFYSPNHLFSGVGSYTVQAIVTSTSSVNDTLTDVIKIIDKPSISLRKDTSICSGSILTLSTSSVYPTYLWNTAASTSSITVSAAGKYWVKATNSCGSESDTVNIKLINKPAINLGNDTSICIGTSLDLSAADTYTNYLWSTSALTHSINTSIAGKYWIKVTNECGITSDTVRITSLGKPIFNLGNDTAICVGTTTNLKVISLYSISDYLWSNSSITSSIIASAAGKYWVKVTNKCGSESDTVNIKLINKPAINLGNDTTICSGTSINLNVSPNSRTGYLWSNGSTGYSVTASGSGKYWLQVTNQCGFTSDTLVIKVINKPSFVLNDTITCDQAILKINNPTFTITNYLWSNSSSSPSITVTDPGKYWLKVTNVCGSFSDTSIVTLSYKPIVDLGNDTSVCLNSGTLSVSNTYLSYLWQDGSTDRSLIVRSEGAYWVRVTNECGNGSDTLQVSALDCSLIIPNILTINGDGINDIFKIENLQLGAGHLKIVNRWGNPIFETEGYNNDWKPNDINDGVYYYIMNYPPDNKTYTGFVTIFNGK